MKNYGFTLVELIITIAIMGIILLVAVPSVARLQQNNKYEKIVSYGQSMVVSGKLYVDENQEDLWGSMTTVGSRQIPISTLKNANLMKDFNDKKITCSIGSFIVNRTGSQNDFTYTYQYSLTCSMSGKSVICLGDSNTSRCTEDGRVVYNSES